MTETIFLAILASSGVWTLIVHLWDSWVARKRKLPEKVDEMERQVSLINEMVRGLAYDRICHIGQQYIMDGSIDFDERENFRRYLYEPYHKAGGDGTAEQIMRQVDALPLKSGQEKTWKTR